MAVSYKCLKIINCILSMPILKGSGGMCTQENFECFDIESESIFSATYMCTSIGYSYKYYGNESH